jgi:hypothetical protein
MAAPIRSAIEPTARRQTILRGLGFFALSIDPDRLARALNGG